MKRSTKLVLKREALSSLATQELGVVVGASVLGCTEGCQVSNGVCVTYTCPSNRCTEFCDIPQLTHAGRCHT